VQVARSKVFCNNNEEEPLSGERLLLFFATPSRS